MNTLQDVLLHLRAGRWTEAHNLVQDDGSPLGAWLHAIVHIVEGDLEDAEYWYGQAGRHFRSRGTLDEELARFEAVLLQSGVRFNAEQSQRHGAVTRATTSDGWSDG